MNKKKSLLIARHCAKFSRNLKHSRVNPVPKLEEEEEEEACFEIPIFQEFLIFID